MRMRFVLALVGSVLASLSSEALTVTVDLEEPFYHSNFDWPYYIFNQEVKFVATLVADGTEFVTPLD